VAEGLLLGPSPDVVHHGVGQLDPVEAVDRHGGIGQVGQDPVQVAPVGINGASEMSGV
jgi:hypothetical protein